MIIWAILTRVLVVAVLVGFNALYVAGEFGSISARKIRIMQMAEQGNRLAKLLLPVLKDRRKLDSYIAASQVGITISSIVLGIYGQRQIAPHIEPLIAMLPLDIIPSTGGEIAAAGIAAILVLILLTTLQVILGELLPKSLALQHPERIALATTLPMKWSADYLLKPLIFILNGSGDLLLKLLGISHGGEHTHVHSPEEIIILVKESHRGGLLDTEERRLLRNVFRVRETTAGEIAVPRRRIVAAPIDKPVREMLNLVADSAYTRIPIYEKDIDHIIGFVHLRDLFELFQVDEDASVHGVLRKLPFVPESLPAIEVWGRLNEAKSYLAVVVDEFGGTGGLITREDLIEELFGEFQDEFDHERALITPAGEGRLIVRGDMLISYLNEMLGIELPHERVHTIGGLVLDSLGRLPEVGEVVEIEGIRLRVEAVTDTAINAVCILLPSDAVDLLREETD